MPTIQLHKSGADTSLILQRQENDDSCAILFQAGHVTVQQVCQILPPS